MESEVRLDTRQRALCFNETLNVMKKRFISTSLALSFLIPTATGLWYEKIYFAGTALIGFLATAFTLYLICLFINFDDTYYLYYWPRMAAWFGWWSGHAPLPITDLETETFWESILAAHLKRQGHSTESAAELRRHMCKDALKKLRAVRKAQQ